MIEQERKFKLKYLPNELYGLSIKQAYLMLADHKQLRVRITNDHFAFICYKSSITDILRNEYEYEIPIEDGIELFNSTELKLIKIRYKTSYTDDKQNKHHIDIDVYPDGLSIVEIEFINEISNLPDYCGEEITGNPEYSNINIAIKNSNHKK